MVLAIPFRPIGWGLKASWAVPIRPPGNSEENSDQQRKIKNRKKIKPHRQKNLEEDRQQGNAHGDPPAKPVDTNLLARCISNRPTHSGGFSVVEGGDPVSGLPGLVESEGSACGC